MTAEKIICRTFAYENKCSVKPTIEYIQQKFDEFNHLCFSGSLQPLPFRTSRARTYLGQITCRRHRTLFGQWRYSDFVFRISTLIDIPQDEVDDTILHEMIHYYILSHQMHDTSTHGRIFRTMMNDINQRFHRHITISHRKTREEYDQDTQSRQHLICRVQLSDGRSGIIISARSRLLRMWDAIPRIPSITSWQWYISYNPYFNRYPRSLSLKVYAIDSTELSTCLQDARLLLRKGDTIHIISAHNTPQPPSSPDETPE